MRLSPKNRFKKLVAINFDFINTDLLKICLEVVSATFLLVFLSLKESTCETRKNVFYSNLKAFFVLEKIKNSNFVTSSNALAWNKKYTLVNNLESKHSLLMKFGQFMSYYKRKKFMKKFHQNCDLKTGSRLFCICYELSKTSTGKWNFLNNLCRSDMH